MHVSTAKGYIHIYLYVHTIHAHTGRFACLHNGCDAMRCDAIDNVCTYICIVQHALLVQPSSKCKTRGENMFMYSTVRYSTVPNVYN